MENTDSQSDHSSGCRSSLRLSDTECHGKISGAPAAASLSAACRLSRRMDDPLSSDGHLCLSHRCRRIRRQGCRSHGSHTPHLLDTAGGKLFLDADLLQSRNVSVRIPVADSSHHTGVRHDRPFSANIQKSGHTPDSLSDLADLCRLSESGRLYPELMPPDKLSGSSFVFLPSDRLSSSAVPLLFMIRLFSENFKGTVNLFQQDHAHELVRKGHR